LQIGGPSDLSLVRSAHFLHKTYLSTEFVSSVHSARIQSSLAALPLLTGTVDAVVLAHLLEFADSPLQLLQEIHRVLSPEGQLFLLSFNPMSLWGLARIKRNKRGFPWSGNFYSNVKIKRWLQASGYSIVAHKTLCFRPPMHDTHQSRRWQFLETLGACCLPGLGAVNFIVAQKNEIAMTPLTNTVRRRRVKVSGRIIEPTTRT
jgi:SAM-dependent methyltransferase